MISLAPSGARLHGYENLLRQLMMERLTHRPLPDQGMAAVPVVLRGEQAIAHVRWEPVPGIVDVALALPLTVPEAALAAVGAELHRVNFGLSLLGFCLDATTGRVVFRTHALLGPDGLAPGAIGALLAAATETSARHLAGLRTLARGYV